MKVKVIYSKIDDTNLPKDMINSYVALGDNDSFYCYSDNYPPLKIKEEFLYEKTLR